MDHKDPTAPLSASAAAAAAPSDSDDSAVVVTHDDATAADVDKDGDVPELLSEPAQKRVSASDENPKALQIVSIGTEQDSFAFQFDEAKMSDILRKVPNDGKTKVAVLSVVGAFRTGKSFLLSWFLRYLHHLEQKQEKDDSNNISLDSQPQTPWYKQFSSLGNDGFEWKAGSERNTTGIWMWSHPFVLRRKGEQGQEDPLAILLVDTQGMFDHDTTMSLTASIFGFSTLLSSFQIYNVDKRIQEDNLQQLALFAEYARIAVGKKGAQREGTASATAAASQQEPQPAEAPFQRMEFLVRDWQHFDDDDDGEASSVQAMEESMQQYLNKVLEEREAADLKDTRAQIMACFEQLTCFGLCHPGFAVTKKKYTGDVNAMEDLFVKLLDRYCQRVFQSVQPKAIHGRTLTGLELSSYISAYAELFAKGAKFPQAVTMLEATAAGNNANAVQRSTTEYKDRMDRVAGPNCNYLSPQELEEEHAAALAASLNVFCEMANFGSDTAIAKAKRSLQDNIHEFYQMYEGLNDGRNPWKNWEVLGPALAVLLVTYLASKILTHTCTPHMTICRKSSDFFDHVFYVLICFLIILSVVHFQQFMVFVQHMQRTWTILMNSAETPPRAGGRKAKAD